MPSREQVAQYREEGYFITDDAVHADMLEELAAAAVRVADRARSGEVVDDRDGIRTGGEGVDPQFIEGLMAPEFGEPVFAEYLGSKLLARNLQPFIGDEIRLGAVHLCCIRDEYNGGWHRDIPPPMRDVSEEVEVPYLANYRRNFVKWHLALVDDPCLWLVPGSHLRYRTEREHECLTGDYHGQIPDAEQIMLKKGETIIWTGNTIHRGFKPDGMGDRSTLMGNLVDHRSEYDDGEKGDQGWLLADNIRDSLPATTRRYYDNWRSLAEPRMAAAAEE